MRFTKKRRFTKKTRSSVGDALRDNKRKKEEAASQPRLQGPRFRYTPLDPDKPLIRLIEVSPLRSKDGLIQCWMAVHHLRPVDFEDYNEQGRSFYPYHCLSYTWGDQSKKRQIRIDGNLYNVGQNLWEFLNALRRHLLSLERRNHSNTSSSVESKRESDTWPKELPTSPIWIDALCINQNDKAEKEHQVRRMGQIYKEAEMVLIWLGNDMKVKSAAESLQNLNHPISSFDENQRTFMKLEYWSRAWIVQEIALTQQPVIFLKSGIYNFIDIAWNIDEYSNAEDGNNDLNLLVNYLTAFRWKNHPIHDNVLHVLNHLGRSKKCEYTRDRIYSILAITEDKNNITVDYDVPLEGLATRVLIACRKSVCFCSASILFEALKTSGTPTSYIEVDVPSQSRWLRSFQKCEQCDEEVACQIEGQPAAMLCLSAVCSTFKGHIYAVDEQPNINTRLNTAKSRAVYFTVRRYGNGRIRTLRLNGSSIATNNPDMPAGRHRWRITVESLMKMAQLEKRIQRESIAMCDRSKRAKECDQCALGRESNQGMSFSWWGQTNTLEEWSPDIPVHYGPSCTMLPMARSGIRYCS